LDARPRSTTARYELVLPQYHPLLQAIQRRPDIENVGGFVDDVLGAVRVNGQLLSFIRPVVQVTQSNRQGTIVVASRPLQLGSVSAQVEVQPPKLRHVRDVVAEPAMRRVVVNTDGVEVVAVDGGRPVFQSAKRIEFAREVTEVPEGYSPRDSLTVWLDKQDAGWLSSAVTWLDRREVPVLGSVLAAIVLSGQICKFVRGQDRCSDQALGSAR